jgi:hypothetical protein
LANLYFGSKFPLHFPLGGKIVEVGAEPPANQSAGGVKRRKIAVALPDPNSRIP